MGLNPMLQQWSITQVVVTLAEDVLELLEQLIELLLLERGEALREWWLAGFWVGCEEGEAEAGASVRWTTSRTLILCPA